MENNRKGLKRRIGQDNRGLSLVELVCAIAIFSMVTAIIGTVIVISARTYNKGISETGLQQEAQLAANRISTIVQDACEARFDPDTSTLTLVTNEVVNAESNERKTYTIQHEAEQLLYSEGGGVQVPLADKIEKFQVHNLGGSFNEEEFKNTRTLYLDMQVKNGDKIYNVNYAISARNEMTVDIPDGPAEIGASIFCDSSVVMVPGEGEHYKIPISIAGKLTQGVEAGFSNASGGLDIEKDGVKVIGCDMDGVLILVDKNVTTDHVTLTVQTKDRYEGTVTPKAKADIVINIRRVKSVNVTYVADRTHVDSSKSDYTYEAENAVYTFYANVVVDNPEQMIGSSCEAPVEPVEDTKRIGYQKPRQVEWTPELAYVIREGEVLNNTELISEGTELGRTPLAFEKDTTGDKTTIIYYEGVGAARIEYLKIEYKNDPNETVPKAVCTLLHDWPSQMELTMTATSKHAAGLNKASSDYADVSGKVTIRARNTKVNNAATDIVLEPNEDGYISINMKGGSSDLDCYLYECTNAYGDTPALDAEGEPIPSNKVFIAKNSAEDNAAADAAYYGQTTYAKYISSTKEIKIHLGINEVGNFYRWFKVGIVPAGKDPGDPDHPQNGAVFVRVRVRRVEYLKMSYKTPAGYNDGSSATIPAYKEGASYQFKVDVQRWNLKQESTLENDKTKYISPYAVEISWDFKKGGSTSMQGSYVCTDLNTRIDKDGNKTSSNKPSKVVVGSYKNEFLEITDLYSTEDGPCIKVKLLKDFPGDAEFTVYATALHPLGTYDYQGAHYENRTKQPYADISDSVSLNNVFNETTAIVADPTQGMYMASMADMSSNDHRYELCVPIEIKTNIGGLDAQIVGNKEVGTKVLTNLTEVPKSRGTALVYLAIDPKETGGGSGTTKLAGSSQEIKYDCKAGEMLLVLNARAVGVHEFTSIAQVEIPIHLRRVEEVKISKKSGSSSQIVLNGNVTKGCGDNWTEYFRKQDAKWDTKGEGTNGFVGYKTPYSYKWELSYDGGKTWIPLDQNNAQYKKDSYIKEYIDSVQVVNPTDSNGATEGTLTLNLKKNLETGVQIKMTSLHSIGENRGGKPYDKEVYDIYTVNDDMIMADGFKRGKDYTFIKDIVNVRADVFEWGTWLEQASFYRYKELDAVTWSKYHMMDSGPTTQAWANYVPMSYLFRPDKEYAIEIVSVLYNKTDKLIYWPLDEELLEPGRGWAEAGFTLWKPTQEQWKRDLPSASEYWWPYTKYEECYNKVQGIPEVKQTFMIPKSEMSFYTREDASSNNALTVSERVTSAGSEVEPIRLNGTNGNVSEHSAFIVNLEITGYEMNTDQQCFRTIVQKKSGDQWVTLGYDDDSIISSVEGFKVDSANPYISIYRTANAQGLYRVVPVILAGDKTGGKIKWRDVTDTPRSGYTDMDVLFNPEYTTTEESYHLYDYITGKYVIYFEFYR